LSFFSLTAGSACTTPPQKSPAQTSDSDQPLIMQESNSGADLDSQAEERIEKRRQRLQAAQARRDIILGMEMQDVRSTWGEPAEIQMAGDARQGNQKWTYQEGLSSQWHISSARVIYFERGRVAGWESKR